MAKFDIKKIKEAAKKDFEKAWVETAELLPRNTEVIIKKKKGQEHPFVKMAGILRKIFLEAGFDEIKNLTILPEEDVFKEYGPEAAVILDRAFYLAKLPRPEIGMSKEKIEKIKKIIALSGRRGGDFNQTKLKEIFRKYKKGEIESDDLVEEMVVGLKIQTEQATAIIDLFPEFKKIKPEVTNLTLRSHMTATWYHTLAALQNKKEFPVALFSIGPRYRNEQKEDASHLRVHNSLSIVIMDPEVSLEAGRKITKKMIEKVGFSEIKFIRKKATSKYYARNQEEEVFVKHREKWLEIGDIGMYSAISLANFGIEYPVFNAGFGIERLIMVLGGYKDIREMFFPQFYLKEKFSEKEIAESIYFKEKPEKKEGREIASAVYKTAKKWQNEIGPVEFLAWEGEMKGKKVIVKVIEPEKGKRLIGPAGFNKIFIKDKNIIGALKEKGMEVGIDYLKSIANKAAYDIENKSSTFYKKMLDKNNSFEYRVRIVRSLADVNLEIPKPVEDYLKSEHKKIDIRGPVFITVKVEIRN
jgi:O-phosphoseryl-tRNA synthetase